MKNGYTQFVIRDSEIYFRGNKLSIECILTAIEKHEKCRLTNQMCMCFNCRVARLLKGSYHGRER